MSAADVAHPTNDAWAWWQSRRLTYNLALAAAGALAYGLTIVLHLAFRSPMWRDGQTAISMTLLLGAGFLVLMGAANIFYLLGPVAESVVKPPDPAGFRRAAYGMGLWGSAALPFVFPLVNLAALIAGG